MKSKTIYHVFAWDRKEGHHKEVYTASRARRLIEKWLGEGKNVICDKIISKRNGKNKIRRMYRNDSDYPEYYVNNIRIRTGE